MALTSFIISYYYFSSCYHLIKINLDLAPISKTFYVGCCIDCGTEVS